MEIQKKILLKNFTTLGTGGLAEYFAVVKNENDLHEVIYLAKSRHLAITVLGGGSNLLVSDHRLSGLFVKNEIRGIKFSESTGVILLEVGAGELLDDVVALSASRGLSGLENLSGIPGTVGGAVVQNAGAYGVEIKDALVSVRGINLISGKKFIFSNSDCQYGYRDSIFKKNKKYFITSVSFRLSKKESGSIGYAGLKEKLKAEENVDSQEIRQAVLQIRSEKLPDWHQLGTAGSFFKNPIITKDKYLKLKEKYPDLPGFFGEGETVKLSLGWILDQICHLRGYREGGVGLYEKQALVLVNLGQAKSGDIKNFSEKIKKIVKEKTGLEIEEEVETIN